MNKIVLLIVLAVCTCARAEFIIATNGKAACRIVQAPDATETERRAAADLAKTLREITGAEFVISNSLAAPGESAIVVGSPTPEGFSSTKDFGAEEFVAQVKGNTLFLAGGRPRGTLYAVNRFLQDQCGVRFWTPWATTIPHSPTLSVTNLNLRVRPAFEYREPFWFSGFNPEWKARNGANGSSSKIPDNLGGCIEYKGFAHTFYPLVEPDKQFATHPEWFSLIKGKRTHVDAQLCLTNPKLREYVVERVKEWLRAAPGAQIVSVTQNDCHGWCECPACQAVDLAEESHAGTMMDFVNYVAEKIEPEFPHVAVDTFAYQYTRKPPKTVRPRSNVIVRLCSIECNFREPLDHGSNAAFLADLEQWSKICSRLYIWDYTTDFQNYINPHPNWFTLGANVRIFQRYGVKGLFEQGAYQGHGAEMAELRAWVLAQLLWNPQQDDRALIREFVEGYYGKLAAGPICQYLDFMHKESSGFYLACFLRKDPPHLRFEPMAQAELLWQQAESAAATDPEKLQRVRIAHLPLRHAWLKDWEGLRHKCLEKKAIWPLSPSRKAVAEEFASVCKGVAGQDWTQIRLLNETGLTVDEFIRKVGSDVSPEQK